MKLDGAFPNTPKTFEEAIITGIQKGERRMKVRNKLRYTFAAAAMVLIVALAALAAGTGGTNDITTLEGSTTEEPESAWNYDLGLPVTPSPILQPLPTASPNLVYVTANGRFYHSDSGCQGMQNASAISVETATAMGKLPCPICVPEGAVVQAQVIIMEQDALKVLRELLPGCEEVYCAHYNTDQLKTESKYVNGGLYVQIYAGSNRIASFDTVEQDEIRLYFNDVSLFDKLISGCSEKGLTEKLYCLYVVCGKELLPGILSTVHASANSQFSLSAADYAMNSINATLCEGDVLTLEFNFALRNNSFASFIFDVTENDNLSVVHLVHY